MTRSWVPAAHPPEKARFNARRAASFRGRSFPHAAELIKQRLWKWVLEPLKWIIPLRLNCCLNSRGHKLCYSCFIKKQSWRTICLTHYMAELSSKGRARATGATRCPYGRMPPALHVRGRDSMQGKGALQNLMGRPSPHSKFSCKAGLKGDGRKRWPGPRCAKPCQNPGEACRRARGCWVGGWVKQIHGEVYCQNKLSAGSDSNMTMFATQFFWSPWVFCFTL